MRAHYWRYEIGLQKTDLNAPALRFGSAWARAMEARWNARSYEEALAIAIPENCQLDDYAAATVGALLAGYYKYYGEHETFGQLHPEVRFQSQFDPVFSAEGKIDGLGRLYDGRTGLIEAKTTSQSLAEDSEYWMRLRFNLQVVGYVHAAREKGWQVSVAFYDVTRKPSIRPKFICDLDSDGLKIVLDSNNNRVINKNGTPRQTGSEKDGWNVKEHIETPDEYGSRLLADCNSRPDFYFARREVPVLDSDVEEFLEQRHTLTRIIMRCRTLETKLERPEQAWPRNVDSNTCGFCQFKDFCLQSHHVSAENPPAGFHVGQFNPELDKQEGEIENGTAN
jgi:hypothetical protein